VARTREPPAPEAQPRRSILDRIRDAPKLAASLGAIVALVASVVALWREFSPTDPPAADTPKDAVILEITFRDKNRRFGDFLDDVHREAEKKSYTNARLDKVGLVFNVKVEIKGRNGVPLEIRYTMLNDENGEHIYDDRIGREITPDASVDRGTVPTWVPAPPRTGRYVVRFDITDRKGEVLGTGESPAFHVAAPS
jgi:hypothetical protein